MENTQGKTGSSGLFTQSQPESQRAIAAAVEPKRAKPTAEQMHNALHASLKAMVAGAVAAGQRDMPAVVAAQEALALCEPEPEPVEPPFAQRQRRDAEEKAEADRRNARSQSGLDPDGRTQERKAADEREFRRQRDMQPDADARRQAQADAAGVNAEPRKD